LIAEIALLKMGGVTAGLFRLALGASPVRSRTRRGTHARTDPLDDAAMPARDRVVRDFRTLNRRKNARLGVRR